MGEVRFRVTADKRVFLNDFEIPKCAGVNVDLDAGRDSEVVLRITADRIDIDGYTNGMADFNFPSQSST